MQHNDLVRRLTGFTPEAILALEQHSTGDDAVAYLSGSRVAGYANTGSDIDVFVISNRPPDGVISLRVGTRYAVCQHLIENKRVDFEIWTPAAADEVIHRLPNWRTISRANPIEVFSDDEIAFLHWMKIGIPLRNSEEVAAWRDKVNYRELAAYLERRATFLLDALLEDVIGMLDSKDHESAIPWARRVLDTACDAFTFSRGNTHAAPKWRVKILRSLDDPRAGEIEKTHWRLSYPDCDELRRNPSACERYLKECIDFANQITDWIIP